MLWKLTDSASSIATAGVKPSDGTLTRRLWGPYIIALSLVLTAAWIVLIGYGIVILVRLSF